jgi:hypothetical protein
MKKQDYIRICPKCGSTNVFTKVNKANSVERCRDCNYSNITFPEVKTSEVETFRKELKQSKVK